ncbi:MAG TPA: hypothetical protein VGG39_36790 [Polyangiaceae bacterium]|jgi:hypothetical protein
MPSSHRTAGALLSFLPVVALLAAGAHCSSSSSGGSGTTGGDGGSSSGGSSSGASGSSSGASSSSGSASSSGSSSGSASGGGDASTDPFVGDWTCTGSDVLTFTQPAGAKQETDPFTTSVVVVANADGSQTATVLSADGGAGCGLQSTVSGDTATLEPNQTCPGSNGVTASYTSGVNTLTSATTYTIDRTFTFSGSVTTDAGSHVQVAGTGVTSGTCTKQ